MPLVLDRRVPGADRTENALETYHGQLRCHRSVVDQHEQVCGGVVDTGIGDHTHHIGEPCLETLLELGVERRSVGRDLDLDGGDQIVARRQDVVNIDGHLEAERGCECTGSGHRTSFSQG